MATLGPRESHSEPVAAPGMPAGQLMEAKARQVATRAERVASRDVPLEPAGHDPHGRAVTVSWDVRDGAMSE